MKELFEQRANIEAQIKALKVQAEQVDEAIASLLEDDIRDAYGNKNTGTVRFAKNGLEIKVSTTKTVDWDNDKLRVLRDQLIADGQNPDEYITTKLTVSETRYNAWPDATREAFELARTVKAGKMKIELVGEVA